MNRKVEDGSWKLRLKKKPHSNILIGSCVNKRNVLKAYYITDMYSVKNEHYNEEKIAI